MTKKAQIEIMGLMVIVLILVFVILISLKFLLTPKTNSDEIQRQSIQASNMLNAIIRSNTEDGSTIAKKIVECYNSPNQGSPKCKFLVNCINPNSCDNTPSFSRSVLKIVFKNKKYGLWFEATGSNPLPSYGQPNCDQGQAQVAGSATVSVSPHITIKIILCVQPQESISS